jgi:hypothetical protein
MNVRFLVDENRVVDAIHRHLYASLFKCGIYEMCIILFNCCAPRQRQSHPAR